VLGAGADEVSKVIGRVEASGGWKVIPFEGLVAVLEAALG
jgi:hypothetical protein